MALLNHGAAGLAVVGLLLAGCSDNGELGVREPHVGETYVYDTSTGFVVTFTYQKTAEKAGQSWYVFGQDDSVPYPLDTMRYLAERTGGLAYAQDTSGKWAEDFAKPFMEWHHPEGEYAIAGPQHQYLVTIDDDDGLRRVEVETRDDGRLLNRGLVEYTRGDVMPQYVAKWNDLKPDGTWGLYGWIRLRQ